REGRRARTGMELAGGDGDRTPTGTQPLAPGTTVAMVPQRGTRSRQSPGEGDHIASRRRIDADPGAEATVAMSITALRPDRARSAPRSRPWCRARQAHPTGW